MTGNCPYLSSAKMARTKLTTLAWPSPLNVEASQTALCFRLTKMKVLRMQLRDLLAWGILIICGCGYCASLLDLTPLSAASREGSWFHAIHRWFHIGSATHCFDIPLRNRQPSPTSDRMDASTQFYRGYPLHNPLHLHTENVP